MLNSALVLPLILTPGHKLPCQFPVGQGVSETTVKIWIKNNLSLTNSALKANTLYICTTRCLVTLTEFYAQRGRKLCQVSLSQAIKATQEW